MAFDVFASAVFGGLVLGLIGTMLNVFTQGFTKGGESE